MIERQLASWIGFTEPTRLTSLMYANRPATAMLHDLFLKCSRRIGTSETNGSMRCLTKNPPRQRYENFGGARRPVRPVLLRD